MRTVNSSSLFVKSGAAFLDQAILSGANLVTAIVLMKTVPTQEYGYYSIAFAASLFLVSLQNAVVTTPLAVLLAGKCGEEKDNYAGALYWGQIISIVPAAALGVMATGILYWSGFDAIKVLTVGSVCVAAVGILLRTITFCGPAAGFMLHADLHRFDRPGLFVISNNGSSRVHPYGYQRRPAVSTGQAP